MTDRLPDEVARQRIRTELDTTLFVEAGAGSGKTSSLVDRVIALIDDGTELRHLATITFTEKAAAELRDRIRARCEQAAVDPARSEAGRQRFRVALEQLDTAAISTLHAFAQRILSEHAIEAALPPNVAVLDEVASQLEFEERWTAFRDELLEDPALERTLLLAFGAGIRVEDLRHLARVFGDNWDLVSEPQRIPWGRADAPELDLREHLADLEALRGRSDECDDPSDKLCRWLDEELAPYIRRLRDAPDDAERIRLLRTTREPGDKPTFRLGNKGSAKRWRDKRDIVDAARELGDAGDALVDDLATRCIRRLAVEVAAFTLDAARERRSNGRLEFHDLLVLARGLLRGPNGVEARDRLRRRYQRLLLDEFQDTDPIQVDLAVLIASEDRDAARKPWWDVPVAPGRLFFVGDPKQSIYRFRRADIELYLRAAEVVAERANLTTNFRTSPTVLRWVNTVFGRLIEQEDGSQPAYVGLHPAPERSDPPAGPPVVVLGADVHPERLRADDLRDREAADVADVVLSACAGWRVSERDAEGRERWRDARLGDITILLPARTSLPALERALEQRAIPYRAETSSLVYATPEVRDLFAVLRAVADPSDQLSLVTALRSPAFGCGDDDLVTYKVLRHGRWSILDPGGDDVPADDRVLLGLRALGALHREVPWLSPSQVVDRVLRDRRLLELGHAEGRPRDLWRRLRFVLDQARAWSESEGGTLREYLAWARLQSSETARVAETILPETDDDSVRIMTIHAAKGLEFPITIVSGMTTASRGATVRVQVAFPPDEPAGIKVGSSVTTPEFERFQPVDEQMDFHERLRLLYVACTRAKDHLVVSLHRVTRAKAPDERRKLTNAELLAEASAGAPQAGPDLDASAPLVPPTAPVSRPLIDLDTWEAERASHLAAAAVRPSIGASDVRLASPAVADAPAALDEDTAAGLDKGARDLELPPWQKGRYGTAIGRAVHAVLQTVDLATGAGVEDAAAAQAAAEGVVGREADIAALAHAALTAPVVREAATCRRWRETYVATRVGARTLEGYIDLLYRSDEGLVVVDYKTAAPGADLDARVDDYRGQGGAYAVAVERATGEPVARVVFLFLTAAGPRERDLVDLEAAKREVLAAVSSG